MAYLNRLPLFVQYFFHKKWEIVILLSKFNLDTIFVNIYNISVIFVDSLLQ